MALNSLRIQYLKGKFKMALLGTLYRSIWNHPFIVATLLFLVCLHRYFPFLFYLLVSASPVLICTAVLLGTLLIYGEPNDHRPENHGKMRDTSVPPRTTIPAEHRCFADKDGMFRKDRFAEVRKDIVEKGMNVSGVTSAGIRAFNDMHKEVDREYHNLELNQENTFHNERSKVGFCFANTEDKDVPMSNVQSSNQVQKYREMSQVHDDTSMRDHSDSSLDQQKLVDDDVGHESVDSESDAAEKSSLDALVANVILTPQETLPLLDSDEPQHPDTSNDVSPNSDAQSLKSNKSSGDSEEEIDEDEYENESPEAKIGGDNSTISWTDEDQKILLELKSSELEKNEHLESLLARISDEREKEEEALGLGESDDVDLDDDEDDDDDDDDEEERIDVAKEHVTMWTEEDEKNLSYLGSSELERNQRLENLLMRRRAQRNFSMIDERNLIDLDRPDHLPFHVAPISTTKVVNPFDCTPNNENQNPAMPPIPGSAPSITAPRKNPFDSPNTSPKGTPDLTAGQLNEESMKVNLNNPLSHTNASSNMGYNPILKEDFVETNQKDAVFRRYESFSTGFNFMGDTPRYEFPEIDRKDMIFSRHESFRPRSSLTSIFTTEKPETFHFEPVFVPEQLATEEVTNPHLERQSSQSSESTSDSESESESLAVPVSHEEEVLHHDGEGMTIHKRVDNHTDNESESSDTVDSQRNHQHKDSPSNLKEKVDNDHQKTETTNVNHDTASSSSTSSEEDHASSNTVHDEGNGVVESSLSPKASSEVSNVNHVSSDDDHTHVEPVYDTSPSGVDKNIPFSPAEI